MKAIANLFGLNEKFAARGTWVTGTHGTPSGEFGGRHLELTFFKQEKHYAGYYGWKAVNITAYPQELLSSGTVNGPTVLNWCYSSACVPKNP